VRLRFGKRKWGWGRDLALSQFSENRGGFCKTARRGRACERRRPSTRCATRVP
jgi:hypothetical protein